MVYEKVKTDESHDTRRMYMQSEEEYADYCRTFPVVMPSTHVLVARHGFCPKRKQPFIDVGPVAVDSSVASDNLSATVSPRLTVATVTPAADNLRLKLEKMSNEELEEFAVAKAGMADYPTKYKGKSRADRVAAVLDALKRKGEPTP